jgi:hypothetical protein
VKGEKKLHGQKAILFCLVLKTSCSTINRTEKDSNFGNFFMYWKKGTLSQYTPPTGYLSFVASLPYHFLLLFIVASSHGFMHSICIQQLF